MVGLVEEDYSSSTMGEIAKKQASVFLAMKCIHITWSFRDGTRYYGERLSWLFALVLVQASKALIGITFFLEFQPFSYSDDAWKMDSTSTVQVFW